MDSFFFIPVMLPRNHINIYFEDYNYILVREQYTIVLIDVRKMQINLLDLIYFEDCAATFGQ